VCCVASSADDAGHIEDSTDSGGVDVVLQSAQFTASHWHLSPEPASSKTTDASKKGQQSFIFYFVSYFYTLWFCILLTCDKLL